MCLPSGLNTHEAQPHGVILLWGAGGHSRKGDRPFFSVLWLLQQPVRSSTGSLVHCDTVSDCGEHDSSAYFAWIGVVIDRRFASNIRSDVSAWGAGLGRATTSN